MTSDARAPSSSPSPDLAFGRIGPRALLASPWLVVVFCWPATLLAWYYISLVATASSWRDVFLLRYLIALLALDTTICFITIRRLTRHARAALRGDGAIDLPLARRAWVEALNLPLHTAALIVTLIGITILPAIVFLAARGEWNLIGVGLTGAAMAGACELTVLFPLVQGSTLPLLRRLKAAHPELRLGDAGVRAPPLRAYFAFGLASLTTVSVVLVATLIRRHATVGEIAHVHPVPAIPPGVAIALVIACLGCMAAGMGLQLAMSVLGPMRRLAEVMRRFSDQGTSARAGLLQLGEIGVLCEGFDDMATSLERSHGAVEEREALLRHSQRFEVMASVTAGFAHEVANPLSCVSTNLEASAGEVEQLLEMPSVLNPSQRQALKSCSEALADASHAATQMTYLLRDMRSFSRRDPGAWVSCDVAALMDGALRIASGDIRRRGSATRDYQPCPAVRGSTHQLSQVFLNLLLNAAKALPPSGGGKVHVEVRQLGAEVVVSVADTGHGIPAANRPRIFEALFTSWPSEQGTGLGLHVSREIVTAHGGAITFETAEGQGTTFRVTLPAEQPAEQPAEVPTGPVS
ncbi:MAG: HAMP domain-containing histidine kinase [Deltaproteobacteria bacterium]|nr:HAMP domain-containing histidine kinase [Deltaproteobacteria bacterium]